MDGMFDINLFNVGLFEKEIQMDYKFLRVTKRGTSRVVEVSADGKKWKSLEQAYIQIANDDNFRMEFALSDICSIDH
jgi:hypothetical protein